MISENIDKERKVVLHICKVVELKKSQTKDSDDLLNGTNILSTSGRHTITQTTLNL